MNSKIITKFLSRLFLSKNTKNSNLGNVDPNSKTKSGIRNFSIKKDFYLIAIFIIFISLFLIIWIITSTQQNENHKNISSLKSSSNRIESILMDDINFTSYQMQYISSLIKKQGPNLEYIAKLLNSFDLGSKVNVAITWNMFSWMNKDKFITVDGALGVLPEPVDLSMRDYVNETIASPNKLILGKKMVLGAVTRQKIIPAGMGVLDKNNKYVGSIVFGFDIVSLVYKLESVINDKAISFVVVDNDGETVVQSANKFSEEDRKFIADLLNKNQELEVTIAPKSAFDKNTGYFYYKKIPNLNLGIVVGYDKKISRGQLYELWFRYVLQFVAVILIALVFLVVINKKIINPIVRIGKIAEDIALHKEDIDFPTEGVSEIIDISKQLILINQYKKDLIAANKKIEQLNLDKSGFLSSVSHELQSPMVSIKLISTALSDEKMATEYNEEERKEFIKDIKILAEESLEFVTDLLDVGQLETGNFTLGPLKEQNLADLIARSIKIVKGRAMRSSIKMKTEIEENLPKIYCDQKRIKQILVNLLSNAIKYSPSETTITVLAEKYDNNKVKITVADQGFGMDEEEIKVAMQNYGTVKNENSGRVDSFGLGLPLVHHLVKLSNGQFNLTSKKGEGTKAEVILNCGVI